MDKKESPLSIIKDDDHVPTSPSKGSIAHENSQTRAQRTRAFWDRLWLTDPAKAKNASEPVQGELEKQRLQSIGAILESIQPFTDKRVVDLGCGAGTFCLGLQALGAKVDAVDVSNIALQHLEKQQMKNALHCLRALRAYVPYTELEEGVYDLVLCTSLIADLAAEEQRVLINECYRLVKPEGYIVLATSIDTTTDGALDKWHRLLETELEIISEHKLYNAYFLALLRLREKMPKALAGPFKWLEKTGFGAAFLARRCYSLRGERGVSHVVSLAKRKPLERTGEAEKTPLSVREQRLKRRVWE